MDFIPLAEDTGLIVPLGKWVLNTACKQIRAWQVAGREVPPISVNVSSHQFRTRTLVSNVQEALSSAQVDAKYLCLEVTESAIMAHTEDNISTLAKIRDGGVALSIDDFGTGYSSLSYLTRLPIGEIKIDRSFIRGVNQDKHNAAIVTAVIAMAHSLGLRVVAEGVESEPELSFLSQLGCDQCQGYIFSKPLPALDFSALLVVEGLPTLSPEPCASA